MPDVFTKKVLQKHLYHNRGVNLVVMILDDDTTKCYNNVTI